MELKDRSGELTITANIKVSIAPLWNWKKTSTLLDGQNSSFNRTFMELKVGLLALEIVKAIRFNRTFMELKAANVNYQQALENVSIAPLWNWKMRILGWLPRYWSVSIAPLWNWKLTKPSKVDMDVCFNRTFMELKVTNIENSVT